MTQHDPMQPYGSSPQIPSGRFPSTPKPDSYLAWAIISTLLCCMPLGVVSIVFAARVDTLWMQGDVRAAEHASREAKKWAVASALASLVLVVAWLVALLLLRSGSR